MFFLNTDSSESPGIPLIVSSSGSVFSNQTKLTDGQGQSQSMMVNQPQKISIALKPNEDAPAKAPSKRKVRKKSKKSKSEVSPAPPAVPDKSVEIPPPPAPATSSSSSSSSSTVSSSLAKGDQQRMITPNFNFIQKQILPVITEFQQQPGTTINVAAGGVDSDNVENPQHELIKKLLNANKVTLHQTHVPKQANNNIRSPQESGNSGRPVTQVTEQELKSIGISLKHQDQMASLSPAKSDDNSSVKSGGSTQPSTPTSAVPDVAGSIVLPTAGQHDDTAKQTQPHSTFQKVIDIKQEPNANGDKDVKLEKEKTRKRKKSLDAKPIKKRKRGDADCHNSPQQLIPLNLAEAPIRLNMDACPPLGGGTISQLGKNCEECGKSGWYGNWSYDGWIVNAANLYDAIKEFDCFEVKPHVEKTPDIINLSKEFEYSKHFFSIALSDDENSSDDDMSGSDLSSYLNADKVQIGNFGIIDGNNIIAPPTAVEFPVAPASPELEPKEEPHFTFLDRGGEFDTDSSSTEATRNCPSPELPLPIGFNPDRLGVNDPVTVTLTFRNGQADKQNIEQALNAISNIIGYNIVDYKMEPDGRKKEVGGNKPSLPDVVPKDDQRRSGHLNNCKKCAQPIFGEAAKKPIHPKNHPELHYCTFSCMKVIP